MESPYISAGRLKCKRVSVVNANGTGRKWGSTIKFDLESFPLCGGGPSTLAKYLWGEWILGRVQAHWNKKWSCKVQNYHRHLFETLAEGSRLKVNKQRVNTTPLNTTPIPCHTTLCTNNISTDCLTLTRDDPGKKETTNKSPTGNKYPHTQRTASS